MQRDVFILAMLLHCFQSDYFNLWHVFVFWYGRFRAISVFIVEKYGCTIGNTIQLSWEWQSMIVVFTPAFRLTLAIEWCKFIRICRMVAIFNVNFCLRVRETGGQKLRAILCIHTQFTFLLIYMLSSYLPLLLMGIW